MNTGESTAGCSTSGRENGVALLEPERPHKKARFPWEIKGKHHLKNQTNEPTASSNLTPEEPETVTTRPVAEMSSKIAPFSRKSIQEIIKPTVDLLLPTSGNCLIGGPTDIPINADPPLPLDTVISLAETMLLNSGTEVTKKDSPSTRDLPGPSQSYNSIERDLPGPSQSYNSIEKAHRMKKEEEKYISRWQATQTVKGCFDNTINRVLESWMSSPAQASEQRVLAIDMARILNEDEQSDDDNVENEAILMAINAHGLQSMGHPTRPRHQTTEPVALQLHNQIPLNLMVDSSISSEDFEILTERDGSPWPLDECINHSTSEEPANYEPWRPVHEITNPTDHTTSGEDYEYEFMNTAVIQAINSKGLMAAGTDFG